MFSPQGGFLEANTSDGSREVRFAEDDPSALLLVLRIAHLQFRQIPATLNYKQLLNLALVCDKYDTVELVRPWLPRWEKPLRQFAFEPNQEEWLFIAWTFGDTEIYKELASTIVSDSTTDEVGQCFRSGRLLGNNMPPGAIG